jgi:ribosomal-protein-alanine N-acetyltransferase
MFALADLFTPAPPPVRVAGKEIYMRPPARQDWAPWKHIRLISREFLKPWEPTWSNDLLTQSAYYRRLARSGLDWREGAAFPFFIFRAEDDALIGGMTLSNVRQGVAKCASLGYWVGQPYAGHGYMSEAIRLTLDFAFTTLGLHRLEAACLAHNKASRSLLVGGGFREEGCARKYLMIDGEWQDHVIYALLREEWSASNASKP